MKTQASIYIDEKYQKIAANKKITLNQLIDRSLSATEPYYDDSIAPNTKDTNARFSKRTLTLLNRLKGKLSYDEFIYMHFIQYATKPLTFREKLSKMFPNATITEDSTYYYITKVDVHTAKALLDSEHIIAMQDPMGYLAVPKEP